MASPASLKIMISGAPASGKGTQCELISKQYGVVHVSVGDLLRAEVEAQTENGKHALNQMEKGMLVSDEIVIKMVRERLAQRDVEENGWLLDGCPRSSTQSTSLEEYSIRPDIFLLLDVLEESIVGRVVGRRLDPVTNKVYHLNYSPPEAEEIAARLIQRIDDTEEKLKLRLQTYHENLETVLRDYKDVIVRVDGNSTKPDDWDDEEDGEWTAPTIPNPEYKGPWKQKKIKNPKYQGKWKAPMIDNPGGVFGNSL